MSELLLDIATSLMGAGSHTSRVVRNVSRMAESFGYEIFITVFQKNMTMMARKKGSAESITLVRATKHMALNFQIVSDLSALSWDTHDKDWDISQARKRYEEIMATPRMSRVMVLLLVAAANASFCKLFNGDLIACGLVYLGTLLAFYVRQEMMAREYNHSVICVTCAFISSMVAGMGHRYGWGSTPDIALATSVLFLIPGVPLINSIMDIFEGHVLTGISRMVNATILIVSISVGIFMTFIMLGLENF